MRGDRNVERMRGVAHGLHLVESPHLQLALVRGDRTGGMDLDPVAAVLDLTTRGGDHLLDGVHHGRVADFAFVGDETSGSSADRSEQRLNSGGDARTFDGPGFHRIANLGADAVHGVGVHHRRDTREEEFGKIERGHHGGQSRRTMEEQLVVRLNVVERDVAVSVDQPGHHGEASRIDHGGLAQRVGRNCARDVGRGGHGHDLVVHGDDIAIDCGSAGAVDDSSVGDVEHGHDGQSTSRSVPHWAGEP